MRTQVWVEIPEDYELVCDYMRFPKVGESVLSNSGSIFEVHPKDGPAMNALRVIVRPAWVWPSWITAPYLAMDQDGSWWLHQEEPDTQGGLWVSDGCEVLLDKKLLAFDPPPCTDWCQSLRRNPHLKVMAELEAT